VSYDFILSEVHSSHYRFYINRINLTHVALGALYFSVELKNKFPSIQSILGYLDEISKTRSVHLPRVLLTNLALFSILHEMD